MSESKIQVSFKLPNGTIPLFRGDTTEEVETLITSAVTSETFVGTLEAFAEAVGLSKPAQVVANPVNNIDYAIASLGATSMTTTGDAPTRHCLHGKMSAIQGQGQYGVYKGFFCAAPQGATDKCKTIYLKKTEPDWNSYVPEKMAKAK
jgi:hypothetical protein